MTASHQELAERLDRAYTQGAVPPLRDGLDPHDVSGAYAVQRINTRRWTLAGRKVVGRKVGLTAAAAQAQLGVNQPDYGMLFDDMQITDGGVLPFSRVLQPKVEAEVALILQQDLLKLEPTIDDVVAATSHAVAAIEIVDSRIADWKVTFADTVADNGSSAFFALGRERRPLAGLDLYSCGMVLERNGLVASVGAGAACLGHPLEAARWLAETMYRIDQPLRAGDIVLTGALGPMVAIKPGDSMRATIGGLGSCTFTYQESPSVNGKTKVEIVDQGTLAPT